MRTAAKSILGRPKIPGHVPNEGKTKFPAAKSAFEDEAGRERPGVQGGGHAP